MFENLEKEIDALLEYHQIPACSIAVVTAKDDGVVWKKAFGEDCSVDSKFHLFSGTKLYTAAAIFKLVQDGKIALHDPVTQHLPDEFERRENLQGITVEQCLGHTTGLKDTPMVAWMSVNCRRDGTPPTLLDCLRRFDFKRVSPAGMEPASYGNINFVILGNIIQHVTQQSYQQFVQEKILEPLGSKACFSFRTVSDDDDDKLMAGTIGFWNKLVSRFLLRSEQYHALFRDTKCLPAGTRGAGLYTMADFDLDAIPIGGLIGTAHDFLPLMQQVLRHCGAGSTTGEQKPAVGLAADSWKNMVSKHYDGRIGVYSRDGVGYAFKIGTDFVNHEGGGPGFTTESRCYLEDGIAMVVMTNKWSITMSECTVCHKICELIRKAFKARE